jgi:two-component system, LuxR family, response regulator FixJ
MESQLSDRLAARMDEHDTGLVAIVDDDQSLRRSLRNLLGSVGFRVAAFASAEEFLASASGQTIGCLVLDLRLDGMSGLDLLRHLADTGSGIPVVILTAHGDEHARQRAVQAGARAFLRKPVHGDVLLDAIRSALRRGDAGP